MSANVRLSIVILIISIFSGDTFSQYYASSIKNDAIPLAIGIGLTGLSMALDNEADDPTISAIALLDPDDLNFLDRNTVNYNSSNAQTASDLLLYSSMTLPFITYFSSKCRADGGTIALMALETVLITNGLTDVIKFSANRYRPFNYNPNVDLRTKLDRDSNHSFVSGHTSNTTAFAFLTAKVLTDLHPDMKHKYAVWTTAATIPAVIGYLRIRAGKHFPTDVITGYAIGAAVGYLIPSLHLVKNKNLTIQTVGISSTHLVLKF